MPKLKNNLDNYFLKLSNKLSEINQFETFPNPCVGAVLVNKKVASGMKPGTHGSTFGGNPLAMSVGNAVLDLLFKKGFLNNVKKNGTYFKPRDLDKVRPGGLGVYFIKKTSKFCEYKHNEVGPGTTLTLIF